jgi:hypothetical protein
MDEPEPMMEIHAIREKFYEETKNMSPEEKREYSERKSRDTEASFLKLGYKFVPVEGVPGHRRLVRI